MCTNRLLILQIVMTYMITVNDWIIKTDIQIEEKRIRHKNSLYIMEAKIIEDGISIEERIAEYYDAKNICTKIKRCPLKHAYEIALWWD